MDIQQKHKAVLEWWTEEHREWQRLITLVKLDLACIAPHQRPHITTEQR